MNGISLFFNNSSGVVLVVFFVILVLYLWYAFSIIYHLIRFGIGTKPKTLALIFFIGSIVLFAIAISTYAQVNWKEVFSNGSLPY